MSVLVTLTSAPGACASARDPASIRRPTTRDTAGVGVSTLKKSALLPYRLRYFRPEACLERLRPDEYPLASCGDLAPYGGRGLSLPTLVVLSLLRRGEGAPVLQLNKPDSAHSSRTRFLQPVRDNRAHTRGFSALPPLCSRVPC